MSTSAKIVRRQGRRSLAKRLAVLQRRQRLFEQLEDRRMLAIVISEIMYNPASNESQWEWVEVHNTGTVPVDMTGYVLDDNNSNAVSAANISSGIVQAGRSAVLFDSDSISAADFQAAWGTGYELIGVTEWNDLELNNGGDRLGLWNSFANYNGDHVGHNNVIDDVPYNSGSGWPISIDGASIYLTDLGANNAVGGNWALSQSGTARAYTSTSAGGNGGADIGSPGLQPPETPSTGVAAAGDAVNRYGAAQLSIGNCHDG